MKLPKASETEAFPPKIGEIEIDIRNEFNPQARLQYARENLKKQKNDISQMKVEFRGDKLSESEFSVKHIQMDTLQDELEMDRANSLKKNRYSFKNPFDLSPARVTTIPEQSKDGDSFVETANQQLNKLQTLKQRLVQAEKNEIEDISNSLFNELYDGAGDEPIDPYPFGNNPKLHGNIFDDGGLQLDL